jgi:branched-chain amino acid transport system substrate-binding protein
MNRYKFWITALLSTLALAAIGCGSATAPARQITTSTPEVSTPAIPESSPSPRLPNLQPLGKWVASPLPLPNTPREVISKQLRSNPDGPRADSDLYNLALYEFADRNFDTAARYLQTLEKRFPLSSLYEESEYLLGLALQAGGRYRDAFLPLRGSLSKEKTTLRRALLLAALGEVYESRKDPYAALESYAKALGLHPALPNASLLRARIFSLAKMSLTTTQVQTSAKRFKNEPAGPILRLEFIHRAIAENRPETALAAARLFLKDYPKHREIEKTRKIVSQLRDELDVKQGRVGVLLPLSGPAAAAGERVYQGVQLALRHALEQNSRLRIQLAVRDTRSTAQKAGDASAKATELIEKEKVVALIGPFFSLATEEAASVAHKKNTPLITPFAIRMDMKKSSPMVFRNSLTNQLQSKGIAAYAVQNLGIERFAVLYPDDRDGRELAEFFSEDIRKLGGRVVKMISFSPTANDFGPQMRALGGLSDAQLRRRRSALGLKKNEPYKIKLPFDALFVPTYHDKAVLISPQVPFYNMQGIRLLGGRGWNNRDLIRYGEKYVERATFVDGFFPDSEEPRVVRFSNDFIRLFGRKPDIFSALGYDAAMIVFSGLAKGGDSRDKMRTYLSRLIGFEGVMGLTDMGPDGDTKRQLFVLTVKRRKIEHLQMVTPHRAIAIKDGAPQISNGTSSSVSGQNPTLP